jgi:hypothetical protein
MKRNRSITAGFVGYAQCVILASAWLNFVPVAAETVRAVGKRAPCDWLQEVKRTNTWFERDQGSRMTIGMLYQDKQMGKPVTDQQLKDAERAAIENDKVLQGELDELVARCGWPTTSGYGDKAPQYASFIVQHADLPFQERYLPMMQAAADAGELAQRHVAMLVDRMLMRKGLPQRYGSQLTSKDGALVVYPIEDPERVDARRTAVGMVPASFCAYIASFEPAPQSELCSK